MLKRFRSKSFYGKRPGKEQALEFGQTLMPVTGYINEITKSDAVHMDAESFPGGRGIVKLFLVFFTLMTMQTLTKRFTLSSQQGKSPVLRQQSWKFASSREIARYIAITFTIGLLQILKAVHSFSKKYCHFR